MSIKAEWLESTVKDLRSRGGDKTDVEVKSAHGGAPDVKRTLCAFGNMPSGGHLIFGLDERREFESVGVLDIASLEQSVASQARQAVKPPVHVAFTEAMFEEQSLLVVQVNGLPSDQQPCFTGGKAYLRQSDGDYAMSDVEIAQIQARRQRPRFDIAAVPGTSVHDLDVSLLTGFLSQIRGSSRRLSLLGDEEVLQNKGVLVPGSGELTLAGMYALAAYPQRNLPSLAVTAAVEGQGNARSTDLVHLDGPLPELLDQAIEWVRRNTRSVIRFGLDGHGRDEAEIPLVAVRELVANALVHRDLSPHTQGKRVEIRLKDDVLMIGNPGGLWGVSVDQLGRQGGKSAVNEYLYDLCKYVRTSDNTRVIEGEGGGIRAVREALNRASMRQPKFVDAGVRFTALVPRHALLPPEDLAWLARLPQAQQLSDMQRAIAVSMRHGTEWTNPLVRHEYAPIDSTDARAALQGLVSAGIAKTVGAKKGTRYLIADGLAAQEDRERVSIVREVPDTAVLLPPVGRIERRSPGAAQTKNADLILAALGSNDQLSAANMSTITGLTRRQVTYALDRLMSIGLVVRLGPERSPKSTYRLSR